MDRPVLALWGLAHIALLVLAWAGAWVTQTGKAHAGLTAGFEQWDAVILRNIAQHWYFSAASTPHSIAFLPGYPLLLTATHLVVRNWVVAELLISTVAGGVALMSLARLAGDRRAALYLLCTPAAIFLTVGYAESLFLAFAIPAWAAGKRGQWVRAAFLAEAAGFVRINAVFLIPALVVMALTGARGRRLLNAVIVACASFGPLSYMIYLYTATHSWDAWRHANQDGWDLHYVGPWQSLKTSWWAAFEHAYGAQFAFMEQLEIAGMILIIVATIAFLATRQWSEAIYCGLTAIALGTTTWYQTIPRSLLVLFPICIGLTALARRWSWMSTLYLAISGPIAAVVALMYLSGQWAG